MSPLRLVQLVEGNVLRYEDIHRITLQALCGFDALSAGTRRRLEESVRSHVRVMGYADPLNAPLDTIVDKVARTGARSDALLTDIVRAWADLATPLATDVRAFITMGNSPAAVASGVRRTTWRAIEILEVADAFCHAHTQYNHTNVVLMLCWLTRSVPPAQEWARVLSRSAREQSRTISRQTDPPAAEMAERPPKTTDRTEQAELELVQMLQSLRALPSEAPDWPTIGRLAESLSGIYTLKAADLDRRRALFQQTWQAMLSDERDILRFFGFDDLQAYSRTNPPDDGLDELTVLVSSMAEKLRTYEDIRTEAGASLVSDLRKRAQMQDIEQWLLNAHEQLADVLEPLTPESQPAMDARPTESVPSGDQEEQTAPDDGRRQPKEIPPETPEPLAERVEDSPTTTPPEPPPTAPPIEEPATVGPAPENEDQPVPLGDTVPAGAPEAEPHVREVRLEPNGLPQSVPPGDTGSPWLEQPSAWEPIQRDANGSPIQQPKSSPIAPDAEQGLDAILGWLRRRPSLKA